MRLHITRFVAAGLLAGCATPQNAATPEAPVRAMNEIAESYVKAALMAGVHDPDFVDAYYGPPEWKKALETMRFTREAVRDRAVQLRADLNAIGTAGLDSMSLLRRTYLDKQLLAMETRLDIVNGKKLSFDDESRLLYDAVAPSHPESYFQNALAALDRALPGTGPVAARYEAFRSQFVIPRAKLDTVFRAAIAECRARTARHVALPAGESFTVEYVNNKPWSGYNWYQGDFRSVIQVNTDLPIFIDRAVDLACHEGYPGHHVFNALLERHLTRDRGWVEFSVYALFSPQSLIAEGSANYGIEMAFPGAERAAWERDHLFALAGLDPSRAESYYRVAKLAAALSYAQNEAARRYINGEIDANAAAQWMTTYGLMEPARAKQRVSFIDKYRSYVINYNLGADLVKAYVERLGGADEAKRWRVFGELLSSPRLPSGLR